MAGGYRAAEDISGGLEQGFGWCDLSIVDGRRQSAADAYLSPVLTRPNLDVVTGARVDRLLVDGDRCTGVAYHADGELVHISAGEVVLTAGTIGCAQLLMLSGIGPGAHLREAGVRVVADLPGVGANLHDHPMCGVVYHAAREVRPHSTTTVRHSGCSAPASVWTVRTYSWCSSTCRCGPTGLPGPEIGHSYTVMVSLMAPYSRGTLRLDDADPTGAPVIDPRYYADPRDLDMVVAGPGRPRDRGRARAHLLARERGVARGRA